MYVGNINNKNKLIKWLKEFYNGRQKKTPNYAVLHGPPGNGKTYLVETLAQSMKLNIHKVTPDDNFKEFLQTINMCKLDDLETKKLILIDSIDEFNNTYIQELDIVCIYPVIYTSVNYPPESLRKGLTLSIKKPFTSEVFTLLKAKQQKLGFNHSNDVLLKIAEQSISVRSAINSLYTGIPQTTSYPDTSPFGIYLSLKSRRLQQDLDIPLLHMLTKNLNLYTDAGLKVLEQFAEYDYRLKVKFEKTIPKYEVNNMTAPIEQIQWLKKQKYNKKQSNPQPPKKQEPIQIQTHTSITDFF